MRLHAEIQGLDGVMKRLDTLDKGLSDRTPFLRNAGTAVLESTQRNFREGGRPKWEPLSMVTILLRAKKRAKYREHKDGINKGRITSATFRDFVLGADILKDTGPLMASIGNPSGGGIYDLQRDAITVGTALKQARPLQDGVASTKGKIPGRRIPPRPFMLLQDSDKSRIYDMAVRFVEKQVLEANR